MTPLSRLRQTASPWLLVAGLFLAAPAAAQQPPRAGLVDAALRLRQLDGVKRVLMIGAHPDDEDSQLVAALARGYGVETAYLSLTRGDGGQNLIGPELSAGLAIVRTGELEAARSIDGGRQFFTRAIDYGFSKSAEEAFAHWPREELLRDVVWVIRSFRPQVIVSVFSGTPADGHGQHQAAGMLAPEAFDAAADPSRFPEQLAFVEPWRTTTILRRERGDQAGTPLTRVETGVFDPILGRSWYQIAMDGRSQHRSQDQGGAQPIGPRATTLVLVKSTAARPGDALFAGVDTTLAGLLEAVPADSLARASELVRQYREAIHGAEASISVVDPGRAAPPLARALRQLDLLAPLAPDRSELARAIAHHRQVASDALLDAAGVVVEAATSDAVLVPGDSTTVTVRVWNGGTYAVDSARAVLALPAGWVSGPAAAAADNARGAASDRRAAAEVAASGRIEPGELATWSFRVRVPDDAPPSDPYFMREPRDGDLFHWPADPAVHGLPIDLPLINAGATLGVVARAGEPPPRITSIGEAPFVGVDQALGEYREPVLVVPALSVATDQATMAWPLADRSAREVAVRLRSEARGTTKGTVRLEVPAGWTVEPASVPFEITGRKAVTSATFQVRPPAGGRSERVALRAVVEGGGRRWDRSIEVVDYPHIRRTAYLEPTDVEVSRVAVEVKPGLSVGYVMGTGDGGYEALRQMGVDAELLTPERVRAGDFSDFDAIVIGVRAYETRPDLLAANARLLDFARAGGTVIVQYQQYQYANNGYAPYPLRINNPHDRVTDETAPVRTLDPESPLFRTPNRITADDFADWRQERGLYFLGSWDERYTPLLEMNDPGEAPLRGSLVVAPLGEGLYVYTALAFFRQFPAAVPGAYRLFANLVSLDAQSWARR
jgi:LmbE family N-acetylglucosaminyl deacetylase